MHRRPLLIQSLLRAALRSLEPWLRSLQNWFRAVPSRLRALEPWLRSLSLESVLRDAEHLARRPSRVTLGVAAGTVLATAAVLAAVSGGAASPAAAVSDQDQGPVRVPAPSVPRATPPRPAPPRRQLARVARTPRPGTWAGRPARPSPT